MMGIHDGGIHEGMLNMDHEIKLDVRNCYGSTTQNVKLWDRKTAILREEGREILQFIVVKTVFLTFPTMIKTKKSKVIMKIVFPHGVIHEGNILLQL